MRNSNGSPIFSDFKTGFSCFYCFPMAGQRERRLCMGTRFEILRQDVRTINTITIQELLCSIEQDHELKIKKNRERRITKMKLIFILKVSPFPWVSYTIAISLVVHTMFVLECERVNLKQIFFIVPRLKSNHDNLLLQIQTRI